MIEAIDRLFKRLGATYGARWDASLGQTPITDVKTVWAHELSAFANNLHRIAWALENLPERCPNAIEFKNLCRQAPAPVVELRIDAPKADPARVAAELAKLGHVRVAPMQNRGNRDWAHRIIQRHADGAKVTPTVLRMAKDAIGEAA